MLKNSKTISYLQLNQVLLFKVAQKQIQGIKFSFIQYFLPLSDSYISCKFY